MKTAANFAIKRLTIADGPQSLPQLLGHISRIMEEKKGMGRTYSHKHILNYPWGREVVNS